MNRLLRTVEWDVIELCRRAGFVAGVLIAMVYAPHVALGDVKLPAMFTDHAVLQRDMPLPVWGTADPGEEVTVVVARGERNEQTQKNYSTVADDEGNWQVTLEPLSVGDPITLLIKGKNELIVKDILVGEVWLCSGQSNMEWSVANSWNGDLAIAAADNPNIRLITVGGRGSQSPVEDFDGKWEVCSPETVNDFSAVGYYFGRELEEQLDVPIGLIDNAWGGSACDAWIRRDKLEGNPLYAQQLATWDKLASDAEHLEDSKKREEARNRLSGQHRPANLYHARLEPVMPYGIRGAIWYQGESNAGRAFQYREMFPLMIETWREAWDQGDFPFYWVQLADFMGEKGEPQESAWAELREAQTMALDRLPETGEAVIIDIGEASDIHPRNKLEVARRLARWALANDYGKEVAHTSPRYELIERNGNKLVVRFKEVNGALRTVDAAEVEGFAIAGGDRKWHWAKAKITGPKAVEVWSDEVEEPVAVRYAWADNPVCNLYDTTGLPATPFRTDDWPGVTDEAR